jgi:hypothetical protein
VTGAGCPSSGARRPRSKTTPTATGLPYPEHQPSNLIKRPLRRTVLGGQLQSQAMHSLRVGNMKTSRPRQTTKQLHHSLYDERKKRMRRRRTRKCGTAAQVSRVLRHSRAADTLDELAACGAPCDLQLQYAPRKCTLGALCVHSKNCWQWEHCLSHYKPPPSPKDLPKA